MEGSRKVYGWLALLGFALFALSSIAGQRMVVSQLPEAARPLAEVETNVVFSTGAATDNKWTLTIERDAATSNSVEVVFGCDANEDGVLGIEEGELSIGWDCGEWFWRDRRSNAACRVKVWGQSPQKAHFAGGSCVLPLSAMFTRVGDGRAVSWLG